MRWTFIEKQTCDSDVGDNELYNLSKPTSVVTDFGDDDDENEDEYELEEMTTR